MILFQPIAIHLVQIFIALQELTFLKTVQCIPQNHALPDPWVGAAGPLHPSLAKGNIQTKLSRRGNLSTKMFSLSYLGDTTQGQGQAYMFQVGKGKRFGALTCAEDGGAKMSQGLLVLFHVEGLQIEVRL